MNQDKNNNKQKIPEIVIERLSRYHSTLYLLEKEGVFLVSSERLAQIEGLSDAQVRRDLSFFGSFGQRGVGYDVITLKNSISNILGLNREWNIAIIGTGHISNVLLNSEIFREKNLNIVKIFDKIRHLIGQNMEGIVISDIKDMETELDPEIVDLVVIALPPAEVQSMVNRLSKIGIKGVLYFASRSINVPDQMIVRKRDISIDLGTLAYQITHKNGNH